MFILWFCQLIEMKDVFSGEEFMQILFAKNV